MLAPLLALDTPPPPIPEAKEPFHDLSENFVQDYRQTGYRVGNVLYLRSPQQMAYDRKLALHRAARKVVLRRLVKRAADVIGRERIEAALNELRIAA